ncbi:MAG: prolipoprotein diacylglyceryl transferase [Maricaulaceae bacterium]
MLSMLINAIPFPDWISPNIFSIGNFSIKWYGISYIVGIYAAYFYAKNVCSKKELFIPEGVTRGIAQVPNKKFLEDMVFYLLIGIILGGRIGSILLYNTSQYIEDPIRIFKIWEGGMSFHGGFAGVIIAVILLARSRKVELWRVADMAAIGAPLGLFMVRLFGNFFNQELYGRPTDVAWGFIFNSDPLSTPRHPSQLYEAALEGLVLWALIRLASHKFKALTKPGICAGIFFLGYGVFRIFVEFFREPDPIPQFGDITRGMAYSMPLVVVGLAIIIWAKRRPPVGVRYMKDSEDA